MATMTYELPLPYKSFARNRTSDALTTINVQRNQHYAAANQFKSKYGALIRDAIPDNPPSMSSARLTYTLYLQPTRGKPTKAEPYRGAEPKNIDLMNLLAVVDKVNSDILVELGIIPDDSIRYIQDIKLKVSPWSTRDYIEVRVTETQPIPDHRRSQ